VREKLAKMLGKREVFSAVFEKYGKKSGWKGPVDTILLADIKCNEEAVADHVWMTVGKRFSEAVLTPGDRIEFKATVARYEKGYRGHLEDYEAHRGPRTDYLLSYPGPVRNITVRQNALDFKTLEDWLKL
jgi:hypothetical protein